MLITFLANINHFKCCFYRHKYDDTHIFSVKICPFLLLASAQIFMSHTFHIPVLGLGYSVDTPLKVARFGISSVVSIVDDELAERMRKFHTEKNGETYIPISKNEKDSRAKRITAYLNLLNRLVNQQIADLKQQEFKVGTELSQYFEMLPENSVLKNKYELISSLPESAEKLVLQAELRNCVEAGAIDVNIMSKVDKANYNPNGDYLGEEYNGCACCFARLCSI